jgi:hypothetical protein
LRVNLHENNDFIGVIHNREKTRKIRCVFFISKIRLTHDFLVVSVHFKNYILIFAEIKQKRVYRFAIAKDLEAESRKISAQDLVVRSFENQLMGNY